MCADREPEWGLDVVSEEVFNTTLDHVYHGSYDDYELAPARIVPFGSEVNSGRRMIDGHVLREWSEVLSCQVCGTSHGRIDPVCLSPYPYTLQCASSKFDRCEPCEWSSSIEFRNVAYRTTCESCEPGHEGLYIYYVVPQLYSSVPQDIGCGLDKSGCVANVAAVCFDQTTAEYLVLRKFPLDRTVFTCRKSQHLL